jgi:hypothetical protein
MYGQKKKKRHVGPSQHWNIRLSSSITDTATIDDDGQQDTFMFDKEGHKRSVRHPAMSWGGGMRAVMCTVKSGLTIYARKIIKYLKEKRKNFCDLSPPNVLAVCQRV